MIQIDTSVSPDTELGVYTTVKSVLTLKRQGKITPTILMGSSDGANPTLYFLSVDGIYRLSDGGKYKHKRIFITNWVLLTSNVTKYPLNWLGIKLETAVISH